MKNKKLAIIGLGKMGHGFAKNACSHNYQVFGYDKFAKIADTKINVVNSINELVEKNGKDGIYLLSLPQGEPTKQTIVELVSLLNSEAVIIDASNNNWNNTKANNQLCLKKQIELVDAGTSGGPSGAEHGACFMVGGSKKAIDKTKTLFLDLAQKDGFLHVGLTGAGHFCKMVHNGIEYGMMQAIAEGFAILDQSEFQYDLHQIATLWNHGSVIRSWLIELTANVFKNENLEEFENTTGFVDATGEAKWTVETALKLNVPAPVIAMSLMMRQQSTLNKPFANKLLAQLRKQFGGHAIKKSK